MSYNLRSKPLECITSFSFICTSLLFLLSIFFDTQPFIFPILQNHGIPKLRDSGVKISHIMGVKITEINIKNMSLCHGLWYSIIDWEGELMSEVESIREDQSFMVKCIIMGASHKNNDQIISCKTRKVFKNIIFYCLDSEIWLHVCDLMKLKCSQITDTSRSLYISYCVFNCMLVVHIQLKMKELIQKEMGIIFSEH